MSRSSFLYLFILQLDIRTLSDFQYVPIMLSIYGYLLYVYIEPFRIYLFR